MGKLSLAGVLALGLLFVATSPSHAMVGDIYTKEDSVEFEVCFPKKFAGARAYLEITDGNGQWRKAEDDWSIAEVVLDDSGCASENLSPAQYAEPDEGEVAYRVKIPRQRIKGRIVPASSKHIDNFKVWHVPDFDRTSPVPHLVAFGAKYGQHVATIICKNPWGAGGQGTGFAVQVNLSESARALNTGSTYLVTAGHVNRECNYSNYKDVTVIYNGQAYPGKSWGSKLDPDVGTVITTAPIPPVELGSGATNRPNIGDIGVSIGVAGGIVGTTTQGQIVGVSAKELNTVIPSGPGASGGPVFNNQGKVIGLIVAGSGSLTVATALPAFCGGVFSQETCSTYW